MNPMHLVYLYLLSPLHTGGTTQEGNLLGIARESHTELPYIPSSSIRGRLRASLSDDQAEQYRLFGNEISAGSLEQGAIWIGDGSILWLPVPSLSHGVIWISSPLLLKRWARLSKVDCSIPDVSVRCFVHPILATGKPVYLKDAILKPDQLQAWDEWQKFIPISDKSDIKRVIVLPDKHCATLIQMSLWRQVKIKLDEHKSVSSGSFRYEEAIPPDTLMYFPWGVTAQAKQQQDTTRVFEGILREHSLLQIGGQESLGRGFVQAWLAT
ncbi:type III-B CRISPR module RAMP protein Cmr4 [Synechococcus sp. PCC 6312]|uniref:type III-B CRISPR module RAMP protein Cmr4 n=1 Tax=Synechococcus sp. (strain ATCC 27167 / PCC 6312) TaxID=195253 RepID=UPI00029F38DD|nr:type III-B CRISPR module RAMP protein Cmr4 [Synechococcus sp. PCC 6312]AFY61933.1 CRISPR-associated protein, Cmr4 family [Synechococcus sp. PCC 6312]